jgi:ubiquinone/menaquinone biosynthesis C-methylase UbiE
LRTYAATLIGVDISIGLLERARELIREMNLENVALIQSGAETLPLQDNVCDAVALIDAIHHVENQEAVIREAWRVAKNNAPFLMMEPNISNPLVYLAHRIPKEERGALRINTAHGLQRLVRPYLKEVTVQPFNYVASKKNNPYAQAAFQMIELFFEKIFFFWPIRLLVQGKVSK